MKSFKQYITEEFKTEKLTPEKHGVEGRSIRNDKHWMNITHSDDKKSYVFSRGHHGNIKAHSKQTYPKKMIGGWKDAVEHGKSILKDY